MNESEQKEGLTKIKVIGVGGGGCNAIKQMIAAGLQGVTFYAVNTDLQALRQCNGAEQIQLGKRLTNGLGTGGLAWQIRQQIHHPFPIAGRLV